MSAPPSTYESIYHYISHLFTKMPLLPKAPNNDFLQTGDILKDTWKIKEKVGTGGFGQIYLAENLSKQDLAIKAEDAGSSRCALAMEVYVLKHLQQKSKHVCTLYAAGKHKTKTKTLNFIVMTLCGYNLAVMRRSSPNGYFSLGTSLRLSMQILQSLEDIHNITFLHRDVKPSNFALGYGDTKSRVVIMLDFGLCRQYIDPTTKTVKSPRQNAGFRGTVRYASITTHQSQEMGPVDDLWSMFYMMVEFLVGKLPWSKDTDRDAAMAKKKENTPDLLLKDQPYSEKLFEFPKHLFTLQYSDPPDYSRLRTVLSMVMADAKEVPDGPFDWEQIPEKTATVPENSLTKSTRISLLNRIRGQSTNIPDFEEDPMQMPEINK